MASFVEEVDETKKGNKENCVYKEIEEIRIHQALSEKRFQELITKTCVELLSRIETKRGHLYNDRDHDKNMELVEKVTLLTLDKMSRDYGEEDYLLGLSRKTINRFLNNTKHLPTDHKLVFLYKRVKERNIEGTVDRGVNGLTYSTLIDLQFSVLKSAFYENKHPMEAIGKDLLPSDYDELMRRIKLTKLGDKKRRRRSLQDNPITVYDAIEAISAVYWPGIGRKEAFVRGAEVLSEAKGITPKSAMQNLKKGEQWLLKNTKSGYFMFPIWFSLISSLFSERSYASDKPSFLKNWKLGLSGFLIILKPSIPTLVIALPLLLTYYYTFSFNLECDFDYQIHGTTVVFATDTNEREILSWEWNTGDGSPIMDVPSFSHQYQKPGRYQVSLTIRDNRGSYTCTKDIAIFAEKAFSNDKQGDCPCNNYEDVFTDDGVLGRTADGMVMIKEGRHFQMKELGLTKRQQDQMWDTVRTQKRVIGYIWKSTMTWNEIGWTKNLPKEVQSRIATLWSISHNLISVHPVQDRIGHYPELNSIILDEVRDGGVEVEVLVENLDFLISELQFNLHYPSNFFELDTSKPFGVTLHDEQQDKWKQFVNMIDGMISIKISETRIPERGSVKLLRVHFRIKNPDEFMFYSYGEIFADPKKSANILSRQTQLDAKKFLIGNTTTTMVSQCRKGNLSKCKIDPDTKEVLDALDGIILYKYLIKESLPSQYFSSLSLSDRLKIADLNLSGTINEADLGQLILEIIRQENSMNSNLGWWLNGDGFLNINPSEFGMSGGFVEFTYVDKNYLQFENVTVVSDNSIAIGRRVGLTRYGLVFFATTSAEIPLIKIPWKGFGGVHVNHAYYYNRRFEKITGKDFVTLE